MWKWKGILYLLDSNTLEDNVKQLQIAFGEVECDTMQVVGGWERCDWGGLVHVLIF